MNGRAEQTREMLKASLSRIAELLTTLHSGTQTDVPLLQTVLAAIALECSVARSLLAQDSEQYTDVFCLAPRTPFDRDP